MRRLTSDVKSRTNRGAVLALIAALLGVCVSAGAQGETPAGMEQSVVPPPAAPSTTSSVSAPDTLLSASIGLDSDSTPPLDLDLHAKLHWGILGDRSGHSLEEVLALAARANPNWGTFAANHAAAHAEVVAAGVYPNPEIEVEFGRARGRETNEEGVRERRGVWSLSFSQPIEMPGKRLARRVEAEAGLAVVAGETLEFNSTLRAEVAEAYYTVQYYTALQRLQDTLVEVAERLLEIASVRIELGEAGVVERVNAQVELLRAKRELVSARRQKEGARSALNALVGGALGKHFKLSDGFRERLPDYGYEESVRAAVAAHPRLARLAAELEQRYASLDRARTEWWPDVRVGVQGGREFDSDSLAVTAGIEIPLWNRNQGGVARAEAEAQKKYNDIVIALTELRRDAEMAWQNYAQARERVQLYTDGLKQAAQEALEIAYIQYAEGTAGYLDLLTARRVLQETEQEYLEALYNAALAQVRLERARGEVIRCEPAAPRPAKRPAVAGRKGTGKHRVSK